MLSAADESNEALLKTVLEIYGNDFEKGGSRLKAQLVLLPQLIHDPKLKVDENIRKEATKTVSGLAMFLQSVPTVSSSLFGEVVKLVKLLLVCPASVASAERSFSGLRRLKTWLRSSISQERLTHLAIGYCMPIKLILMNMRPQFLELFCESSYARLKNGRRRLDQLIHADSVLACYFKSSRFEITRSCSCCANWCF